MQFRCCHRHHRTTIPEKALEAELEVVQRLLGYFDSREYCGIYTSKVCRVALFKAEHARIKHTRVGALRVTAVDGHILSGFVVKDDARREAGKCAYQRVLR